MVLGVVFDLVLDGLDDAMDLGFCRGKNRFKNVLAMKFTARIC